MKPLIQFFGIMLLIESSAFFLEFINAGKVPVAILALLIMFGLLYFKIIKPSMIEEISQLLIKYMGLFFVPLGVRILDDLEVLEGTIGAVLVIVVVATVVTQLVIAIVAKLMFKTIYASNGKEVTT